MALFLLIAAVWAVFLLPPLWAGWYSSPSSSTRRYSKMSDRLEDTRLPSHDTYHSSGGANGAGPRDRDRAGKLARRRRVLFVLTAAALGTLLSAAVFRSVWMLVLHAAAGAMLVWYMVMLRRIKGRERAAEAVRVRTEPRRRQTMRYRPETAVRQVRSRVR